MRRIVRINFRLQYLLALTESSEGRRGIDALLKIFDIARKPYPRSAVAQGLTMLFAWIAAIFLKWTGIGYGSAKGSARRQRQIISQAHTAGTMLALVDGNPFLMMQFVFRDLLNGHFLGATEETAVAYCAYGASMAQLGLRGTFRHYTERGTRIAEQLGNPGVVGICRMWRAYGTEWLGDAHRGGELMSQAIDDLLRHLPGSWQLLFACIGRTGPALILGRTRRIIDHVQTRLPDVDKTSNYNWMSTLRCFLYQHLRLQGRTGEAAEALKGYQQIKAKVPPPLPQYMAAQWSWNEIPVLLDEEELGPPLEKLIDEHYALGSPLDYYNIILDWNIAYARLEQFRRARGTGGERAARRKLVKALARLRSAALPSARVPASRCHLKIVSAGFATLEGKLKRAAALLDDADRLVKACRSLIGEYYLSVERARWARAYGAATARGHALQAVEVAQGQGWVNRARRVREEFGLDDGARAPERSLGALTRATPVGSLTRGDLGYLDALLKVSIASVSTLDPGAQAEAALKELVSVLHAERAMFFLADAEKGGLRLLAMHGVSGTEAADLEGHSSTVVNHVFEDRQALVVNGSEQGESLGSRSAVALGLRSIIAAPLLLRDKCIGVVYLDTRLVKGLFTEGDIPILLGIGNHIAIAVETARAAQVEAERKALQKDLALTGAVQALLLPRSTTFDAPGLRGSALYRPATQCGGDWWWQDPQRGGALVIVGDVTGHGAPSAMITAAVAGSYHTVRAMKESAGAGEVLAELNRQILSMGNSYQMSMCAVRVDVAAGEVTWWNAGGPPLFVWRRDAEKVESLLTPGNPLGTDSQLVLGEGRAAFHQGDRLLVCTDGIFEQPMANGRPLGFRNLTKLLRETASLEAAEARATMGERITAMTSGRVQEDDMTLVLLDRV